MLGRADSRYGAWEQLEIRLNTLLCWESMDSEGYYSSPPRLYDLRPKAEPLWSLSLFVQGKRFETLNVFKSTGTVVTEKLAAKLY